MNANDDFYKDILEIIDKSSSEMQVIELNSPQALRESKTELNDPTVPESCGKFSFRPDMRYYYIVYIVHLVNIFVTAVNVPLDVFSFNNIGFIYERV